MAGGRGLQALTLVLIMVMAPLAGCFGENDGGAGVVKSGDVAITPVPMLGWWRVSGPHGIGGRGFVSLRTLT